MLHKKSLFTKVVIALAALSFVGSAHAEPLFSDDYSTDTTGDYDIGSNAGSWTHNSTDETLDFVGGGGDWVTDYAMLKSSAYSHDFAANPIVEISGTVTIAATANSDRGQLGLVLAHDGVSVSAGGMMIYADWLDGNFKFFASASNHHSQVLDDDHGLGDIFV